MADCSECSGTGVAERISGYDRPCDVCGGDGRLSARTPPMTNPKHTDTRRSGDLEELERFRQDCGIPDLPTPLTYDLRRAISGQGPRAYDWEDKPHRLVYVACREIEAKAREADELRAEIERLRGALGNLINAYTANVDTYRLGGFYTDPETEDEVIEARAALGEKQ